MDWLGRTEKIVAIVGGIVGILVVVLSAGVRHAIADAFQWCVRHPWVPAIGLLVLVVVLLLSWVQVLRHRLGRSVQVRPEDQDQAGKLEGLIEVVPQAAFLSSWLASTVFAKRERPVRGLNDSLRLDTFQRDFELTGADVRMKDQYIGRSRSDEEIGGLRFVTLAGNVRPDDFDAKAFQRLDGTDEKLPLVVEAEEERMTIFRADFVMPLREDDEFEVRYEDFWSGSMRYGFDGLFYTSLISFGSVGRLESTLTFDSRVEYVRGFSYDFESGQGAATNPQPEQLEVTDGESRYRWHVDRPKVNNLHFIIIDRDRPSFRAGGNAVAGDESPPAVDAQVGA